MHQIEIIANQDSSCEYFSSARRGDDYDRSTKHQGVFSGDSVAGIVASFSNQLMHFTSS